MNILRSDKRDGVLDTGPNVLRGEIGIIVLDDLIKGEVLVEQFQNTLHCDACPSHTGLAKMHLRINHYSLYHTRTPSKV